MNNESAPEYLKHKDNRHVQVRLDYMLIYLSESKAKIIRILESWTDTKYADSFKGVADSKEQKSEPPAEDLWITMSYDQFSLFVYGTIQHDTIKQQVDELVALKHIERRINPAYPYGPPQYRLNRELIQKSLDELEMPANLFDLAPTFVTPRKKHTPQEKYPQGRGKKRGGGPGKIPPPTGETSYPSNNLSKNTKKHTENEEGTGNVASSLPTQAPSQEEPYHPDFSASQEKPQGDANGSDGHSDSVSGDHSGSNHHGGMGSLEPPVGDSQRIAPAQQQAGRLQVSDGHSQLTAHGITQQQAQTVASQSSQATGYEKAEQATLTGALPQASARVAPEAEQETLIERPAVPEMPLQSARWCAETAVLVSEALRGKYYTASQRTNQVNKAKQMFRDFKTITRLQFEAVFGDWVKWWKDHGMGIFTLAGLLARGKDGEVRLQTSLDRLEARLMPTKASSNTVTVPQDAGMVLWRDAAGIEREMSYAEADENGWNGGFGEFIQHTHYGRTVRV